MFERTTPPGSGSRGSGLQHTTKTPFNMSGPTRLLAEALPLARSPAARPRARLSDCVLCPVSAVALWSVAMLL